MATVIERGRGSEDISHSLPDEMTSLVGARTIIQYTGGTLLWWYADWRLFVHGEVGVERVEADTRMAELDGRVVTLGWVDQAETWN